MLVNTQISLKFCSDYIPSGAMASEDCPCEYSRDLQLCGEFKNP